MIQDKIALQLKELRKLQGNLKEIKKSIKKQEKLETEEYKSIKAALKDLKGQVKGMEEAWLEEVAQDEDYKSLKELKMKAEEDMAHASEKLFDLIDQLPMKFFEMKMDTEEGQVRVQAQPEMKIYLNGREEKRRF